MTGSPSSSAPSASGQERYVPAAGHRILTRFYDPAMAATMRERTFRAALVRAAVATGPSSILDVGCGTGSQSIALADAAPLARARSRSAGRPIAWTEALAQDLPLEDDTVDCVTASLLLHHLSPSTRLLALREMRRVLRPGGRLHIADWGRPQDPAMRLAFLAIRALDGRQNTADHAAGRIPQIIRDAGFTDVRTTGRLRTVLGTLELLVAA
jgi:ubiquinone/menaquinone biosynthesis C-methylase UbiE